MNAEKWKRTMTAAWLKKITQLPNQPTNAQKWRNHRRWTENMKKLNHEHRIDNVNSLQAHKQREKQHTQPKTKAQPETVKRWPSCPLPTWALSSPKNNRRYPWRKVSPSSWRRRRKILKILGHYLTLAEYEGLHVGCLMIPSEMSGRGQWKSGFQGRCRCRSQ